MTEPTLIDLIETFRAARDTLRGTVWPAGGVEHNRHLDAAEALQARLRSLGIADRSPGVNHAGSNYRPNGYGIVVAPAAREASEFDGPENNLRFQNLPS